MAMTAAKSSSSFMRMFLRNTVSQSTAKKRGPDRNLFRLGSAYLLLEASYRRCLPRLFAADHAIVQLPEDVQLAANLTFLVPAPS